MKRQMGKTLNVLSCAKNGQCKCAKQTHKNNAEQPGVEINHQRPYT